MTRPTAQCSRIYSGMLTILVCLATLTMACEPLPSDDTRMTEKHAIRAAEKAWSDAAASKDLERVLDTFADEASILSANKPAIQGKEAIRAYWSALVETPGLEVSWQSHTIEVSRDGDLGYTIGAYTFTVIDPKEPAPVTERGKYVSIWKKQPDGSWKVIVDIANADYPPGS